MTARRGAFGTVLGAVSALVAFAIGDAPTAAAATRPANDASAHTGPGGAVGDLPPLPTFLASLRPDRPRLALTPVRVTLLHALVATDPIAKSHYTRLVLSGQRLLEMPIGARTSLAGRASPSGRRLMDRIATLALLHQIDGDSRWADRAVSEMRALASATDWNPGYLPDVAEVTAAMAIGYDWLHAALDLEARERIRSALIEKGLRVFDVAYRQQTAWITAGDEWSVACNAAAVIGALAVVEDDPDLAHGVATRGIQGLTSAMATFGADGTWSDGPAYWDATTGAIALAGASLETSTGSDLGMCATPGLTSGPAYRLHVNGATGLAFNYGDCADRLDLDPTVEWLGQRMGDAWVVAEARARAGATIRPFAVAWYRSTTAKAIDPPLDRSFGDAAVVCLRSAWHDPAAIYCAAKGGDNSSHHAHLDIGSFVLDALGQRWAMDLGPDDFTLPEYFGRKRYTYYRTRTEGHNTLVLDGQNQDPAARASILAFAATAGDARAVIDLSQAYAAQGATRARRGIGLIDGRRRVIVQDELSVRPGTDVSWAMHTMADVSVDLAAGGRIAILSRGNAQLEARIVAPETAWFAVEVVAAPAPQRRVEGVRKLTVQVLPATGDLRIVVILTPVVPDVPPADASPVMPLDAWVVPVAPVD